MVERAVMKESPAPNRGPIAAALYAAEAEKEAARAPRRNYGSARVRVPARALDANAIFTRGLLAGFAIGALPAVVLAVVLALDT